MPDDENIGKRFVGDGLDFKPAKSEGLKDEPEPVETGDETDIENADTI